MKRRRFCMKLKEGFREDFKDKITEALMNSFGDKIKVDFQEEEEEQVDKFALKVKTDSYGRHRVYDEAEQEQANDIIEKIMKERNLSRGEAVVWWQKHRSDYE